MAKKQTKTRQTEAGERWINGRFYTIYAENVTKSEAVKYAKKARHSKRPFYARVVKTQKGYTVYVSPILTHPSRR